MLRWALGFFIIALIAALFGFFGIAAVAAGIAKFLFCIFIAQLKCLEPVCQAQECRNKVGEQRFRVVVSGFLGNKGKQTSLP